MSNNYWITINSCLIYEKKKTLDVSVKIFCVFLPTTIFFLYQCAFQDYLQQR